MVAFNASLFKVTYEPLLITAGVCFFLMTGIKGLYFGMAVSDLFDQSLKKKEEPEKAGQF